MKAYALLFLAAGFVACNNESDAPVTTATGDTLISTNLVHNPRSASGSDSSLLSSMPTIDFKDTVFHYGTVHEGETVEYAFEFVNNGKSPLLISSAIGSCGCTVADRPQEPIAPGKGGVIRAKFNSAGRPGYQEKSITVSSNAVQGTRVLLLQGEVKPAQH